MESLYYYLLFEHGLHPGMANLLSKLVPGVLFGLAVGLSIIAAFAIFNGSGLVLAESGDTRRDSSSSQRCFGNC